MSKLYKKIAKKEGLKKNGCHLVDYVLCSMRDAYVAPPSLAKKGRDSHYTARDVCAAVLAYLRANHPKNPIEKMRDFGIESSEVIGILVRALANERGDQFPRLSEQKYEGLFTIGEIPREHQLGRWFDEELADVSEEKEMTQPLLKKHFGKHALDSLVISKRLFPLHVTADLQLVLNEVLGDRDFVRLAGLHQAHNYEGMNFASLLNTDEHSEVAVGPLIYHDIEIGSDEAVPCLDSGLWLGVEPESGEPFAVVLGSSAGYSPNPKKSVEVAVPDTPQGRALADHFAAQLEKSVSQSRCYRGKILSFEETTDYHGTSTGIKVHTLSQVKREQVILPARTIDLLDRNMIEFIDKRPLLAKRGMNLKKGLLFYGPPGTGKTHTLHYLAAALKDHTVLLISAEQVGLLGEYMTLARLLQPSLVVIEDADLIARDRGKMGVCEEALLNKLLNEMDGMRPDAEILFVLTTNRPEALEMALAARPGRIDQAIEFPHPDAVGREKLVRLYAGNRELSAEVVDRVVRATEKTSGAFIKELMRRATQYAVTRDEESPVSLADVNLVIEEMLFSGGQLNRSILGGGDYEVEAD
jgi:hypothetical protein